MLPSQLVVDLTSWTNALIQERVVRHLQEHFSDEGPGLLNAQQFEETIVLLTQPSFDVFPRSLETAISLEVVEDEEAALERLNAFDPRRIMLVANQNAINTPFFATLDPNDDASVITPDLETHLFLEYGQTETPIDGVALEDVLRQVLAAWRQEEESTRALASWGFELSKAAYATGVYDYKSQRVQSHRVGHRGSLTLDRIVEIERERDRSSGSPGEERGLLLATVSARRVPALALTAIERLALASRYGLTAAATEEESQWLADQQQWLADRPKRRQLEERTYLQLTPKSLALLLDRIAVDPNEYARISVAESCRWGEHTFEPEQSYGINLPELLRRLPEAADLKQVNLPSQTPHAHARRLHQALRGWTVDHYAEDPLGQRLIERLAPEGEPRDMLRFELSRLRACDELPRSAPIPAEDWEAAVRALLSAPCPAAALHWDQYWNRHHDRYTKPLLVCPREALQNMGTSRMVTSRDDAHDPPDLPYDSAQFAYNLNAEAPLGRVIRERRQSIVLVSPPAEWETRRLGNSRPEDYPTFRYPLPTDPDPPIKSSFSKYEDEGSFLLSGRRPEKDQVREAVVTPEVWEEADRQVAAAWWSLRRALAAPSHIRMPDGRVLLHVASGLFAEISVRAFENAAYDSVRASLLADGDRIAYRAAAVYTTEGYGSATTSAALPSLYLTGRGYAADIHFVGSPLAVAGRPVALAQAAEGAHVLFERERADDEAAREDDDDYWD
ncbi:MAG: hypothetical protein ABJF88_11260 [Rhodothermales bacterium]